jgi:hypothetical protein
MVLEGEEMGEEEEISVGGRDACRYLRGSNIEGGGCLVDYLVSKRVEYC